MKQDVIYLTVVICFAIQAHAQTEKGNFLLGGSASFQTSRLNDANLTSFSLSPNISYFFADRFAAGITTPLSSNQGTSPGLSTTSTSYSIGPTLRYYFPISAQWAIFPQVDYYYQWSKSHTALSVITGDNNSTSSVFRANLGITYFIVRNVGLEGILYYQHSSTDSIFGLSYGPSYGIRFGLQIYLLRGKENK